MHRSVESPLFFQLDMISPFCQFEVQRSSRLDVALQWLPMIRVLWRIGSIRHVIPPKWIHLEVWWCKTSPKNRRARMALQYKHFQDKEWFTIGEETCQAGDIQNKRCANYFLKSKKWEMSFIAWGRSAFIPFAIPGACGRRVYNARKISPWGTETMRHSDLYAGELGGHIHH